VKCISTVRDLSQYDFYTVRSIWKITGFVVPVTRAVCECFTSLHVKC
jgi:hypothetical protein